MRLTKTLLATSALALTAAPALAQEGDLTCEREVQEFLQNLRADTAYEAIQEEITPYERRLADAVGDVEEDCFALIRETQQELVDLGVEIEGVSDQTAIAEIDAILAEFEAVTPTEVVVEAQPAQVAVAEQPTDVTVQQEATAVDVTQQPPEIVVEQPQATVAVEAPQQQVRVQQPEAQVDVQAAAPEVQVQQPAPEVQVTQPEPEIAVQQTAPEVTIEQPKPQVTIRQFQPEVEIVQPKPTIRVEQAKPQVEVVQPQPEVTVESAQPQVEVTQAQPQVEVVQAQPEVNVTQRQPEVSVTQPEAEVTVAETPPEVRIEQGQPQVDVTQAEPVVDVTQGEAEVAVTQGEAVVDVAQEEAVVEATVPEGADFTTTQEAGGAEVSVQQEEAADIEVAAVDVTTAAEAPGSGATMNAIAVREVEFPFDSAEVTEDAREDVLRDIVQLINETQDATVFLTGYASPIGPVEYNRQLAQRRAQAVQDVLLSMGLSAEKVRVRSLGEENEEVPVPSPEDVRSEENRRVEIRVMVTE